MVKSSYSITSEDRMPVLSKKDLALIHNASLKILETTGVNFNDETVTDLFKDNGFKTEGGTVFFRKSQINIALSNTVSDFFIHARNPEHTVHIGGDDQVFLPTGGAINVVSLDGSQLPATMADFETGCKLVQTSDQLGMGGVTSWYNQQNLSRKLLTWI